MEASLSTDVQDEQEPVESTSILDRLRARREEVKEQRILDLAIPGYEDELMARYKPVPFKVFEDDEKKRKKSRGKDPALLSAAIDQIMACCEMILVKDPGNPACVLDNDGDVTEYRPIDVEAAEMGAPVKWEQRFADLINIPQDETRGIAKLVVLRTFCNDAALIYHASRLGIWLRDTTKEVDDDLLGE
jgi:hypothetical protein